MASASSFVYFFARFFLNALLWVIAYINNNIFNWWWPALPIQQWTRFFFFNTNNTAYLDDYVCMLSRLLGTFLAHETDAVWVAHTHAIPFNITPSWSWCGCCCYWMHNNWISRIHIARLLMKMHNQFDRWNNHYLAPLYHSNGVLLVGTDLQIPNWINIYLKFD